MKKLFQLVGLVTCIILFAYACNWTYQNFANVVEKALMGIGLIALIALIVRVIYGKMWLLNLGKEFFIGNDLIKATENFLNDLPNPKNESTANLVGHLVYRFTRLGVIGLAIALIPIWLLYNQNQLIEGQSKLLEKQTKRLDQQIYLQEAERRGALVHLMSNILDKVDEELKDDYNKDKIRNLSPQLIGRITALSTRLKPYYYLNGDTLINEPLSPEKGQLLLSLLGSELDSITYDSIYQKLDLEYADLYKSIFNDVYLRGVNLRDANLSEAEFDNVDLNLADLENTNFQNAKFNRVKMRKANLERTEFSNATIRFSDMRGAKGFGVDFSKSYLFANDFRDISLGHSSFDDASLDYVSLKGAKMKQVYLKKAKLYNMNFLEVGIDSFTINNLNKNPTFQIDSVAALRLDSFKFNGQMLYRYLAED